MGMDFIFLGMFNESEKCDIRTRIKKSVEGLIVGKLISDEFTDHYNIIFIEADAKNAQGEKIVLLEMRTQISGYACATIIDFIDQDHKMKATVTLNRFI
jgi:hypothetical protein